MDLNVDQLLQKGVEAHKAGQVKEADRCYSVILKVQPNHPDANHNMGVLSVGFGKAQEAIPFFQKALDANPTIEQFWLSYVETLIRLGRKTEATTELEKAKKFCAKGNLLRNLGKMLEDQNSSNEPQSEKLELLLNLYNQSKFNETLDFAKMELENFPKSVILFNIIGSVYASLGDLDEAIKSYKNALSINRNAIEVLNNMGLALKEKGKLNQAIDIYKKVLEINPHFCEAYSNMGIALKESGRLDDAIDAYNKALLINPQFPKAYNNLGLALKESGRLDDAIIAYNKALSIDPQLTEAYNNLGLALKEDGMLKDAIDAYNKALLINPNLYHVYNNLGVALKEDGKLDDALSAYNKALSINPRHAKTHNNIGNYFRDIGRIESAINSYKKAISINPLFAEAHRHLSKSKNYNVGDPHFLQVKGLYKKTNINEGARCNLNFTLAKMYEDIGEFKKAFEHLSYGNRSRRHSLGYSIDQDKQLFSQVKKAQKSLLINSLEINKNNIVLVPIFIVGMPRSGTTIVEQIISVHSKVTGAGELNYIPRYGGALATNPSNINKKSISKFRDQYLKKLSEHSNGNKIVTDKLPHNFLFIPLIRAAFPEAKIIHVQRNAAATCWSNYKNYFVAKSHGYSYSIDDLVIYYNLYKDLMTLWQDEYSKLIYTVDYEKLVTNQNKETRTLIDYLELDWQSECLSPQNNKRAIRTASQQQIRQKIYQGSSEAWRKFEPFLKGKLDCLLAE